MTEPAETYEHAGVTVEIHYDDDSEHANPRHFDCNLGVMLCSHPRYNLGDEQIGDEDSMTEVECPRCEGSGEDPERWQITRSKIVMGIDEAPAVVAAGSAVAMESLWMEMIEREDDFYLTLGQITCPTCKGEGRLTLDLFTFLRRERGATVVLPLFLFDHSGISISAGANMGSFDRRNRFVGDEAGWDTSSVGVIFDTKDTREETGAPLDKIEEQLRNEVAIYDLYLTGQVYGYIVGKDTPFEDSCWGFLGSEHVKENANEAAEHLAIRLAREANEAAEMAARDIITIDA